MKKLAILILLSISTLFVTAQINFGIKGGINISKMTFSSDTYKTSTRIGPYAGVTGRYSLSDRAAVQADLLLSIEGTNQEAFAEEGNIRETFINLPVMLQYMVMESLYLAAGPQISFLLAAKQDFGGLNDQDIKENFKSLEFRLALGAGYFITENIGAEARYHFSLGGIQDTNVSGGDLKNQVFSVGLFYMLGGEKK